MKTAIFAFTRHGCQVAQQVSAALGGEVRFFTMAKFSQPGFESYTPPLSDFVMPLFAWADTLVFVSSCGIAVRAIAPHVKDKKTDPAVIVTDEQGHYVIPLLSGHIGGANAAAATIASALGATAVMTTATDVNHRFAVDAWAAEKGLKISSMSAAKAVSAAILEREVPIFSDFPIVSSLPGGTVAADCGDLGIYIGCRDAQPFADTLQLIPRILHLGIGCRRGITAEAVEAAVTQVLRYNGIRWDAIRDAASIDLKAQEEGLLEFCRSHSIPITFHTSEVLQAVAGEFSPSAFVKSVTGVDNVCERSAMLRSDKLIVKKTAINGVTVAIGAENWEVAF